MRELKFRAWVYDEEKEEDKMVNVIGIFFKGNSFIPHRVIIDEEEKVWLLPNSELMQFTGLKDSKGKEIYEGDIVIADDGGEWFPHEYDEEKDEYYPTGKYLVEYDSEFARFILIDPKTNCEAECDYNPFSLPDFTLEVIGNKFQNPELLKEVKNEYTVCMESF